MNAEAIKAENLIEQIRKVNCDLNTELVSKALEFAAAAHQDQKRQSGEMFIEHPVQVSYLLAGLKMDTATVVAGLLHDVLEDTTISPHQMESLFGKEVRELVEGVTKIEGYAYHSREKRQELQADNFRKLLISITRDIRVILIKLADRLHNMRTLHFLDRVNACRIARETLDIYAPLANRFGMAAIQWELEDLSFKYLHPAEYRNLANLVAARKEERDRLVNVAVSEIKELLDRNGLRSEVNGRTKHLYSIFRKHQVKHLKFEEILDLIGIRIIVDSVADCYKVLGIIQNETIPLPGSFKDYIAQPKPNNYQSLHLVVTDAEEKRIEIQIRTRQMHLVAEEGIASHWRYKENPEKVRKDRTGRPLLNFDDNMQRQLNWIRNFLQRQDKDNPADFMASLKMNLYPDIIVVSTPAGDYIKLRKHATALDLAFKVHTDIGFHCIGALVNGKHVPVRTELQAGDAVRIITSPQARPSKDWLNYLVSINARQKVRTWFRRLELQEMVELGRKQFYSRIRRWHYRIRKEEEIQEIARAFKTNDIFTFFARLGSCEISTEDLKKVLLPEEEQQVIPEPRLIIEEEELAAKRQLADGIVLEDIDDIMIRYAKCCQPLPGDEIIGYTTRGRGITIHRLDCTNSGFLNLKKNEPERILKVKWKYGRQNTGKC
ncbi:MAG: bifunctional (p)ppGpp synthetase/guanosine-3',5'-bis(diphosphate) 3'-pyrophosphohydrolase [Candidatus Cloacimonetes bacterium]|nr:bifunctional (p)ppGpp synthetase/guanosine-3',5'-bis(diphosphate) 3'-pyrophosphohydrolase [Candidatus Cloacimonadota bacterium]